MPDPLDATGTTTILDNSIVFWGNEDGMLTYADAHKAWGMPALLAGKAGGYFDMGRYVDYRSLTQLVLYDGTYAEPGGEFRGRPYNNLMITLLHAMGITNAGEIGNYSQRFGQWTKFIDTAAKRTSILPYLKNRNIA